MRSQKINIVGAGPSGLTAARILAEKGHQISIYDKRNHIGGNCYDCYDSNGILIHPYGPHFFRTNSLFLIEWLSQFTKWRPAQYIVKAYHQGELLPLPINLDTMIQLHGNFYQKRDFKRYLKKECLFKKKPQNAKEQCLNKMGAELFELIFKNYTKKQWGIEAEELDPSVTARIPIRFNHDQRYPNEKYQIIPRNGYNTMFEAMVDHPRISVHLEKEIHGSSLKNECDQLIYTGPIDQFYNYSHGKLEYRSLRFDWINHKMNFFQSCPSINYPNDFEYTRTVEIKHITGQQSSTTSICYEYPEADGEAFYPILSKSNIKILKNYEKLSKGEKKVHFIGRLAEYKYYNMDHIFLNAIKYSTKL